MPKRAEFPISPKPLTRHSAQLRSQILSKLKMRKSQLQIARTLKISFGSVGCHVKRLRMAGQF